MAGLGFALLLIYLVTIQPINYKRILTFVTFQLRKRVLYVTRQIKTFAIIFQLITTEAQKCHHFGVKYF